MPTGHKLRLETCQIWSNLLVRPSIHTSARLTPSRVHFFATTTRGSGWWPNSLTVIAESLSLKKNRSNVGQKRQFSSEREISPNLELLSLKQMLKSDYDMLLSGDHLPTENDILNYFTKCETTAKNLTSKYQNSSLGKDEATSALLEIYKSKPDQMICNATPEVQKVTKYFSELVFSVICHCKVSINPKALHSYVLIQRMLGQPETFPRVFKSYADKPLPPKTTSPIPFLEQRPNIYLNAIPAETAHVALQSAIEAKKLVVALDIIETAYTTQAFKASKIFRRALLPTSISAVTPFAIYSLASQFARWQTSMDTASATKLAFVGMISYVGLTGTMALVSITTANDQMNRVTWAPGVPLLQRWIREEERAAIDLVACTWGFSDSRRHGEEEGEDWELIKEWVSRRSMILDRVELMEGMN